MKQDQTPTQATPDDELGMAWWNGLTEQERTRWARLAGTGRAKDAWELFKSDTKEKDSLQHYYNECIHMLDRQPGDYTIGKAERMIIADCHAKGRPVTSAVAYIMRS